VNFRKTLKYAVKLYKPPKAAYKLVHSQHTQLLKRKPQIGTNMIHGWKLLSNRGRKYKSLMPKKMPKVEQKAIMNAVNV